MPEKDISKMTFEEALKELEAIVSSLERGQGSLDEAVASYERGVILRKHCEKKLQDAQAVIERLSKSSDGTLSSEPIQIK